MRKFTNTGKLSLPVSFAAIIIVWETLVYILKTPNYLIPAPSAVVQAMIEAFPVLMRHTSVTLLEVILGFASALVLSAVISLLMVRFSVLYKILWPYMVIRQYLFIYLHRFL